MDTHINKKTQCRNTQERMGWTAFIRGEDITNNPFIGKAGGHVDEDAWNIGFNLARRAVACGEYVPTEEDNQLFSVLPDGHEYISYLSLMLNEARSMDERRRILRKIDLAKTNLVSAD